MGRRALTREEKEVRRQWKKQRYLSNPDALARKREIDRVNKQENRRRARLDPLALLADVATQAQRLQHINEGITAPYISSTSLRPESTEEYDEGSEQKNGLILFNEFGDDHRNVSEEKSGMTLH